MIRSVGENSYADCVYRYRALERIFSLKVLAPINWGGKVVSGKPKKYGLANTKVAEAILASTILLTHIYTYSILLCYQRD